jgi:NAD(P)-dependent dehydrogenase (short-subunit alcohol dehydrogenase family)
MKDAVLVTGAGTGLGLETAIHLAERGFEAYAAVHDEAARESVEEAAAQRGVRLQVLKLDITSQADIDRAVSTVVERSGGIYGLVNNAGIGLRGFFEDLADEEIRELFDVNVFATMAMTRAVVPHMRQARRGRITIITSVGGLISSLSVSAYCASKFAQEGFGEGLAQELQPFGIYVSLIEPAIIETERWTINRSIARGAQDPRSIYYAWFSGSERLADKLVETSPTRPRRVAQAVHKFMTARRPRLRYLVGGRAALLVTLRRLMPARWFETLYFGTVIRRVTRAGSRQPAPLP